MQGEVRRCDLPKHYLDMVVVVGSSPIAPTNEIKHLRETVGAFFLAARANNVGNILGACDLALPDM